MFQWLLIFDYVKISRSHFLYKKDNNNLASTPFRTHISSLTCKIFSDKHKPNERFPVQTISFPRRSNSHQCRCRGTRAYLYSTDWIYFICFHWALLELTTLSLANTSNAMRGISLSDPLLSQFFHTTKIRINVSINSTWTSTNWKALSIKIGAVCRMHVVWMQSLNR